jgi:hypothetical protein
MSGESEHFKAVIQFCLDHSAIIEKIGSKDVCEGLRGVFDLPNRPIEDARSQSVPQIAVADPIKPKDESETVIEVAPEPSEEPADSLFEDWDDFIEDFQHYRRLVPEKLTRFLDKGREKWRDLSPEEKQSKAGRQLLHRILRSFDRLFAHLVHDSSLNKLQRAAEGVLGKLVQRLETLTKTQYHPSTTGASISALKEQVPEQFLEIKEVFSTAEPGDVLACIRRAQIQGSKVVGDDDKKGAVVMISKGADNDDFSALSGAFSALIQYAVKSDSLSARELIPIRQYLLEMTDQNDKQSSTTIQYSINHFYQIGVHKELRKALLKLISRLTARGFQEIVSRTGKLFDESYSDSDYEPIYVDSKEKEGQIIDIIRPGFKDDRGTTIQRAKLQVSNGH